MTNVPTSDTGTASSGMSVETASACRKMKTTRTTKPMAMARVSTISLILFTGRGWCRQGWNSRHRRENALFASANSFLTPARRRPRHWTPAIEEIATTAAGLPSRAVSNCNPANLTPLAPTSLTRTISGIGASRTTIKRFEPLGRRQAALRAHRVSEGLSLRNRLAAHLPGGIHGSLRLDGPRQSQERTVRSQASWSGLHPEPHGVLPGAEYTHRADTSSRALADRRN